MYLTFQEYFEKPGTDGKRWGKPLAALLGAFKAQMNLGIGSVTPPVGSCLFVGCGIAHTKIEGVTPYIVKIFAAMVAALFAVTFIPAIPMIIPYLLGLVDKFWW